MMRNVVDIKCESETIIILAADDDGIVGVDGTAPKTVAPFEFVVFSTDELVLQFQPKTIRF